MAYATVAQLRAYLPQVKSGSVTDNELQDVLTRATDVIDTYLGFAFAGYVTAVKNVLANVGEYLWIPAHERDSVTTVTQNGATVTVTAWYSDDKIRLSGHLHNPNWWQRGVVAVTANWGYGTAPAAIVEICLEVAVNIWRSRDRGQFSDVVGVETGGQIEVARMGAFTAPQKAVLDRWRRASREVAI